MAPKLPERKEKRRGRRVGEAAVEERVDKDEEVDDEEAVLPPRRPSREAEEEQQQQQPPQQLLLVERRRSTRGCTAMTQPAMTTPTTLMNTAKSGSVQNLFRSATV